MLNKKRDDHIRLEDWHTHNRFCRHAEGTIEDYIKKAIKFNLDLIGISDHFPYEYLRNSNLRIEQVPFQEYAMRLNEVDSYLSSIEELKLKYKDKIQIRTAFEIDYFRSHEVDLEKEFYSRVEKLDYILGSVHILHGRSKLFAFDDKRFLKMYKEYDSIDNIYLEYYQKIQNMIHSDKFDFDVLSHFDLPKKYNKRAINKDLVMNEAIKTLDLAKKADLTIEINTGGLRKEINEQYPSYEIIEKMHELDIPILFGSDAHHPNDLGYKFDKMLKIVKKIGYSNLAHFNKRKRKFIEI
ncbi:MAG: histidinol-phosphatase HisJ [Promethearchaeota archaeon]|nr:MAG: histidinol-phosphatase HisJ [Candidatus Lokiarchaeota archaeon]